MLIDINGSFEQGWTDLPPTGNAGYLVNQQPNKWQLDILPPGAKLWDSNDKVKGEPECVHKLETQLPESERPNGSDPLILDGTTTYKIFHSGAPFGAKLSQTITGLKPGTDAIITVPMRCHRPKSDGDPYEAEFRLMTNGAGGWWNAEKLPHRKWVTRQQVRTIGDDGQLTIEIYVKSKWPRPVDFFMDNITVDATLGDATPPDPPDPPTDELEQRVSALEFMSSIQSSQIDALAMEIAHLDTRVRELENATTPPPSKIKDVTNDLTVHPNKSYNTRALSHVTSLIIHHTVSPPDRSIDSIAQYHVFSNDWPGIGYHYMLKDDGRIYRTNQHETISYHAGGHNNNSVGIALQGNFTDNPPPQAQLDAVKWLIDYLRGELNITAVSPHREVSQTQCPGNTYKQWFDYITGEDQSGDIVDMVQYFAPVGTYGDISIKTTNWNQGDVRQQLQAHNGYLYVTKGNEFEQRKTIGERIHLLLDDSPGGGEYYSVFSDTGWIPVAWRVGDTFTRNETTIFYRKNNCSPANKQSDWTHEMKFHRLYENWVSPHGVELKNVAHLQWILNGVIEEEYWLAPGLGYAGWRNRHGRESWIKEVIPVGSQGNNTFAGACYHAAFGE